MSINILILWIFCCFLFMETEQKSKAFSFRSLPLMSDKLTIAELPSYNLFEPYGPGTYAFGYEIEDVASNNIQFRDEEKLENGTVRGSYGLVRPNGLISITRYIADDNGYHASTQTFNQNDKRPTLLTSTTSPLTEISSPSDVMFLDVPNPVTISPAIAQQILEQHKVDLVTPSSNIPITDIFSSPDDNSDSKNSNNIANNIKEKIPQSTSSTIQQFIPSSHIPHLPASGAIGRPTQETNEKKVSNLPGNNSKPSSDETFNILQKPSGAPDVANQFVSLLPHIPKLPTTSQSTTQSSQDTNLSDENNKDKPASSTQFPNIFESILPHIPQLPIPDSIVTSSKKPPSSESNNLSDITENESSSTSTTTTTTTNRPSPSGLPQLSNIFENLLPHLPQLPTPPKMTTTTKIPSTSSASDLADENESESSMSPDQSSSSSSTTTTTTTTTSKPMPSIDSFPALPQIFGFLNPANFPIFKPPSADIPNKQENTDSASTESSLSPAMDTTFDEAGPTNEPIFAIIHKNATLSPIYDDTGATVGVQLINNFIPSNFHIIPFIIPSNYFHSSQTSTEPSHQNIAHDEVTFEETVPNFVNDKFHDPLSEDDDDTWKSNLSRKRKGGKRSKVRRNNNSRRRYKYRN